MYNFYVIKIVAHLDRTQSLKKAWSMFWLMEVSWGVSRHKQPTKIFLSSLSLKRTLAHGMIIFIAPSEFVDFTMGQSNAFSPLS